VHSSRLALDVAAVALTAAAVAAQTPAPPTLRLPDGVRPTAVAAELDITPASESFGGSVHIDLEIARPTRLLWLNAERLELVAARFEAGGETWPATIVAGGEQFAGFDAGRELPAGAARLSIDYRGKLDAIETEGLFRQQVDGAWYVYSQFESTFARRAFPSFDEPSYRAPWQLTISVPAGQLAFANTPVVAERDAADGRRVFEFAATKPISSYLVALGVGPFEVVEAGTWGRARTPVRIVVPRGREGKVAWAVEVTGDMLARLEEYFDVPYPFGKLDNLAIPQTVGFGAMENPGLITYSENLIVLDPAATPLARMRAYAAVAAHENAHQWFGNLVTMSWWDDIWLNEGFADWLSDRIVAEWRPDWFTAADRALRRGGAVRADSLPSSRKVRRPIATLDDVYTAFDGISYTKGAALLEMFEAWLGPERFRAGIRTYIGRHAWGNATSDDFLAALAGAGDPALARAFASFLDQPGAPVVTLEADCPADGPARLLLSQRRYLPLGSPAGAPQTWTIPLRLRYGAGERTASIRHLFDAPTGELRLDFCPQWVAGNEEGIGYYLAEYRGELLPALTARVDEIPDGEQIALLDDLSFLVASGDVGPAVALELLPRFRDNPYRAVVESAARIAGAVDAHLVADELRPNYERYLAGLFGGRVAALGLEPRPGESEDDALLRPDLVGLLADAGGNRQLRQAALRLVDRWFADRSAISPDMLGTTLGLAALDGDLALFERYVTAAREESDPRRRRALIGALGRFRDPAAIDRALGLVLSGDFDVREATPLMFGLSAERAARGRVLDWIEANHEQLVARLPGQFLAYLPYLAIGSCDEATRARAEAFFRPRAAAAPGGEIHLTRALESMDQCIARRSAQQQAVSEFLAGQ
jgi:alanyl aminopeptidase